MGQPRERMSRPEQCWNAWSDREIGRQCVVSHTLVAHVRAEYMHELGYGIGCHSTTRTFIHPETGQPNPDKQNAVKTMLTNPLVCINLETGKPWNDVEI